MDLKNIEDIDTLKAGYDKLNWFKKLFFPRLLKANLTKFSEERSEENAVNVYRAFENNTWKIQKWLFSCLRVFANSLINLAFQEAAITTATHNVPQMNGLLNNPKKVQPKPTDSVAPIKSGASTVPMLKTYPAPFSFQLIPNKLVDRHIGQCNLQGLFSKKTGFLLFQAFYKSPKDAEFLFDKLVGIRALLTGTENPESAQKVQKKFMHVLEVFKIPPREIVFTGQFDQIMSALCNICDQVSDVFHDPAAFNNLLDKPDIFLHETTIQIWKEKISPQIFNEILAIANAPGTDERRREAILDVIAQRAKEPSKYHRY